jgi:prepilin-type N-terminal cleavage/methylation domain-containing protein
MPGTPGILFLCSRGLASAKASAKLAEAWLGSRAKRRRPTRRFFCRLSFGRKYPLHVRDTRGFTLVELLMVMVIVAILLSIAVGFYRDARLRGGEAAAIGALDAINQAQFAYMQTCGNQRYAPTFSNLGTPIPGSRMGYLSPDLAAGDNTLVKSGYTFQMSGTTVTDESRTCTGAIPVTMYQVTADPTVPGTTGARYFATNTDRVIFEAFETFTGKMPETGRPPHGTELQPVRSR